MKKKLKKKMKKKKKKKRGLFRQGFQQFLLPIHLRNLLLLLELGREKSALEKEKRVAQRCLT